MNNEDDKFDLEPDELDFKTLYPNSGPDGGSGRPFKDPGEIDKPTFDKLISEGKTVEHATKEAEQVANARRIYSKSIRKGYM